MGASTPIADEVFIRSGKRESAKGASERLASLELTPGKPMALRPWREHLWLIGLKRPLVEGDGFALTLIFARAGSIEIAVYVESTPGD